MLSNLNKHPAKTFGKHGCSFRDITGPDAAGADDGIVTDGHTW
jgi:hypothetical protein